MMIFGAGIAGLLAGCIFQTAKIFEAGPENTSNHKALLRFRSSKVGDAVGIDFRRVRVNKGIWHDDRFVDPNIMLANLYSQKVIGRVADRSVWNLDPVDRFIAPEDFIVRLNERCSGRVEWNSPVDVEDFAKPFDQPVISTLPMSLVAQFVGVDAPEFKYAPIVVKRWRVPNADVFQTVYFTDPATPLYRASITQDLLIAEYVGHPDDYDLFAPFGLRERDCVLIESSSQRYGKIAPIDNNWRKRFIFDLTTNHNVYSLGRFGTWRNLLLDDVIDDINVLKKLIGTNSYDRMMQAAK